MYTCDHTMGSSCSCPSCPLSPSCPTSTYFPFDVYLGDKCDEIIPLLNAHGLSYCNQQKQSKVLLFVFDRYTRGNASCAEAAYYIGKGRSVILVMQPYPETLENMNESADTNRGRSYLYEIAKKNNVPMYDYVSDEIVKRIAKLSVL